MAANSAAHKLAGVLGTFGLTKGTVLAREAEIIYSGEPETDAEAAAQLRKISGQLRMLIEEFGQGMAVDPGNHNERGQPADGQQQDGEQNPGF